MTAGLYRIERLYITLWYERPIQGMVVVEGGQAFLFDSMVWPNQPIETPLLFGQIDSEYIEAFESSNEFKSVQTPKFRGKILKTTHSTLADKAFQSCLPTGFGFFRDGIVEIQSITEKFPARNLLGHWRYPVEQKERNQNYPEVLKVEMNYIFDWYDGPLQGLIICEGRRHLLYEQYDSNCEAFLSKRPVNYLFGELTSEIVINSLISRIKGHPRGWAANFIWLDIGRRKVQKAFDTVRVEHIGYINHNPVETVLTGPMSNVPRSDIFCCWGGSPYNARRKGIV